MLSLAFVDFNLILITRLVYVTSSSILYQCILTANNFVHLKIPLTLIFKHYEATKYITMLPEYQKANEVTQKNSG